MARPDSLGALHRDVIVIALGFYRTRQIPTIVLLLIGKALRFLAWTMLFIR